MFDKREKTHHSAMAQGKKYAIGPRNVTQFLNISTTPFVENKATIYIHVPFCTKICSFCNMRRSLQNPNENYHKWIVEEIKQYSQLEYVKNLKFDAVYFGGGTPTTLSTQALVEILQSLFKYLSFTDSPEITIETTVSELSDEKIDALIENGVNRFSIGVQTFHDQGRKQMGRKGSSQAAYNKLKYLKDTNKCIVSMDLIYNYSGQTMNDLYNDLNKICELDLDGFSMYSLINMQETGISEAQSLNNDQQAFFAISEYMQEKGYKFLELTKMVKQDQYRYVMNRHLAADTLPLGAGAGGSVNGLMLMNEIDLDQYKSSIDDFGQKMGMCFSPDYNKITRFKGDIQTLYLPKDTSMLQNKSAYESDINILLKQGYVKSDNDNHILTNKGIFWGNSISRKLSEHL